MKYLAIALALTIGAFTVGAVLGGSSKARGAEFVDPYGYDYINQREYPSSLANNTCEGKERLYHFALAVSLEKLDEIGMLESFMEENGFSSAQEGLEKGWEETLVLCPSKYTPQQLEEALFSLLNMYEIRFDESATLIEEAE